MTETKTKAKSNGAKTAKATSQHPARSVAETVVDLPVGVVLNTTERLTELVEPFTDRSEADKQLKTYRTQLRRTLKRSERRGATARRKVTTEARKTRNRVEREARKRRQSVQGTVQRNRDEVEQRVRRAIEAPTSRAQSLVDRVGEQLSALR